MLDAAAWVQFGFLGAFCAFTLVLTKYFLDHLAKHDERWAGRFDRLSKAIDNLDASIQTIGKG